MTRQQSRCKQALKTRFLLRLCQSFARNEGFEYLGDLMENARSFDDMIRKTCQDNRHGLAAAQMKAFVERVLEDGNLIENLQDDGDWLEYEIDRTPQQQQQQRRWTVVPGIGPARARYLYNVLGAPGTQKPAYRVLTAITAIGDVLARRIRTHYRILAVAASL